MASPEPDLQPRCAVHTSVLGDPPELTPAAARGFDWFTAAAVITWLACGLWPVGAGLEGRFGGWPAVAYGAAFVTYGAAMIGILVLPHRPLPLSAWVPLTLAAIQSVTGIMMNVLSVRYLGGTGAGIGLLVIVAAQVPYFLGHRGTWTWIAVQTVAMNLFFVSTDLTETLVFAVAGAGFQIFAAASSILALNEGRARTNLARANAELQATRALLAESSRTEERLRISRDLHDTLGHHLAALSLQLDVAARLTEGEAAGHIRQAHAITRLLLGDVRNVVSDLRETSRVDVKEAIRALAAQPTAVRIHLEMPETLTVEEPGRAETLLRAVQEIITNTTRHAAARNLWIRIEVQSDGIHLHARDDGRGASGVSWGNGLTGMRERFTEYSGTVRVNPGGGPGFEVHAHMPIPTA